MMCCKGVKNNMFKKNFIACVKSEGKILREVSEDGLTNVFLPFGSEYSLLLKNQESRKAVVNIDIDGKDVLGGSRVVLTPNSSTELLGELEGSCVFNKFKFIEKTDQIKNYRGDFPDDGFVRIEFKFEKEPDEAKTVYYSYPVYPYIPYKIYYGDIYGYNQNWTDPLTQNIVNCSSCGITVKGSETNQNFITTKVDNLEEKSYVIVLKLVGENVEKPVTVKTSLICDVCGVKNKSGHKFCSNCGNYISLRKVC